LLNWFKRKPTDPKQALTDALGTFELPSFPRVVLEALKQLRDPDANLSDIGKTLLEDPKASARLLTLANSAAYALKHPVRNVEHAASLLGRSEVEVLLLGVGVERAVPSQARTGYDPVRFWAAASRRATLAGALAGIAAPAKRSECYTAALLQDVGIPLLVHAKGDEYSSMLESWHEGESLLWQEESSAYGFNHASIAGWLGETWRFPERLRDAIGAHHDEGEIDDPAFNCVAAVSLLGESGNREAEFIELVTTQFDLPSDHVVLLLRTSANTSSTLAA
jgi:HD-like signal output (HDOD) protein